MTVHHNARTTTAETTTVPKTRRSSGGSATPRWVGPAAMVAVAVTALVGVNELRSTDDTAPTRPVTTAPEVNSGFEPLISPEERAIINGEYPRLPAFDLCATHNPC